MQQAATHFTPAQLLARWEGIVAKGTLDNWRSGKNKRGPAFVKIGGRVLYPIAGVIEWENANSYKPRTQQGNTNG